MRLLVIIGDREYLRPLHVRRARVERLARRLDPSAVVPRLDWASIEDDPYCDTFLEEDPSENYERAELLIEFLQDIAPMNGIATVVLPWESGIVTDPSKLFDPRARRFVALAQERLGQDAVECARIGISPNTRAVLAALEDLRVQGLDAVPKSARTRRSHRGSDDNAPHRPQPPVQTVHVETSTSMPEDFSEMWSNYTRAVITLSEPIIEAATIFGGRGRPDIIGAHLERTQLLIRPDIPPDKVIGELAPGGGLHALFSRPLPLPSAE